MPATQGLSVAPVLMRFMEAEALPGTGVEPARFWESMERILREMAPRNAALLAKRDALQAQIDAWHRAHPAKPVDLVAYTAFLREIGYLLPEPAEVTVATTDVDAENFHGEVRKTITGSGPRLATPQAWPCAGRPAPPRNAVPGPPAGGWRRAAPRRHLASR